MKRQLRAGLSTTVAAVSAVVLGLSLAACTSSGSTATSPAAATTSAPATSASSSSAASTTVSVPSLTGVTSSTITSETQPTATTSSSTSTSTPPPPPKPTATTTPKIGSTGLSPRSAITVSAGNGTITNITLVNDEGTAVKGTLAADKKSWTTAEELGYGRTYTVAGTVQGAGGSLPLKGSWSTVAPDDQVHVSVSPTDGDTVGVGAPILVSIGTDITDPTARANVEKAITVTTTPKTEGSFAWIQHDDGWGLDWRPKVYWKAGTKVTVTANMYGVNMGNNLWGEKDVTANFSIGRQQITKGDVQTHRLQVFRDGQLIHDYPASYGYEGDPGRVTLSGTYIVMSKEYLHLMSNPAYHYTNFKAYYATRISNNGEFIHANDGTADVQGYENVTHGCVNLTMDRAQQYQEEALYGDPVEITGSSIELSPSAGDIYDWAIPWSEWITKSALYQQS
jgi:lipoprotein-anchoring transpeptidase ErfK/SrfK